MSKAPQKAPAEGTADAPATRKKSKLMLIAAPLALLVAVAALWFTGILPHLFGMDRPPAKPEARKEEPPTYVDLPEMVSNLNSSLKHPDYIKLIARIEVPRASDVVKVQAAIPRLQDVMQTYMREMRPEELRGSAGTYRLREELLNRANAAVAPARISDVLFTEMLVQ